eukprot:s4102_g5.t1
MNNRRIPNGPSRRLPTGPLLVKLTCPRWTHTLYGSVVDRRDFYHQAAASLQRAESNAVAPLFCLRQFRGTRAYRDFLARADAAYDLSVAGGGSFRPSSVLCDATLPVHGAFKSLLQGDHAGVEFACSGHEGARLLSGPWSELIIDDLFCVSCEPLAPAGRSDHAASQSELILRRAKLAYQKERVEGSDSKDQFSRKCFNVAGAQIDAADPTVQAGFVLVGLPSHRRLALAHASLTVSSGRYISEELASILAGSWVTALLYRRCLMAAIGPLFALGKKEPSFEASALRPLAGGC